MIISYSSSIIKFENKFFIYWYITKEIQLNMTNNCPICLEIFTKEKRKEVECDKCDKKACRQCYQTVFTDKSKNNFCCMFCNSEWEYSHIYNQFPKSFMNNTGKFKENGFQNNFIRNIEIKELEFFPDTSFQIDLEEKINNLKFVSYDAKYQIKLKENELEHITKMRIKDCECISKKKIRCSDIMYFNFKCECFTQKQKDEWKESFVKIQNSIKTDICNLYIKVYNTENEIEKLEDDLKNFRKPNLPLLQKCVVEGCNGFLTNEWCCRVCNKTTCSRCLTIMEDGHKCDEDVVKSIEECNKNTRACPKCSQRIQKIDGCDQMYCPECATIFSWRTGQIQRGGNIHQPDAIRRLRETGQLSRDIRDIPCGGVPTQIDIRIWRTNYIKRFGIGNIDTFTKLLCIIIRFIKMSSAYEERMFHYTEISPFDRHIHIRKIYIRGKITKDEWEKKLYKNEMQLLKSNDTNIILSSYFNSLADIIRNVILLDENIWNSLSIQDFNKLVIKEINNMYQLTNLYNNILYERIYKIYYSSFVQICYSIPEAYFNPFCNGNPLLYTKEVNSFKRKGLCKNPTPILDFSRIECYIKI